MSKKKDYPCEGETSFEPKGVNGSLWTAVEEKLPDDFVNVIVYDDRDKGMIAFWDGDWECFIESNNHTHLIKENGYDITHWMLPPKPWEDA